MASIDCQWVVWHSRARDAPPLSLVREISGLEPDEIKSTRPMSRCCTPLAAVGAELFNVKLPDLSSVLLSSLTILARVCCLMILASRNLPPCRRQIDDCTESAGEWVLRTLLRP